MADLSIAADNTTADLLSEALADGARARTEVLWLNPAVVDRRGAGPLFDEVAA